MTETMFGVGVGEDSGFFGEEEAMIARSRWLSGGGAGPSPQGVTYQNDVMYFQNQLPVSPPLPFNIADSNQFSGPEWRNFFDDWGDVLEPMIMREYAASQFQSQSQQPPHLYEEPELPQRDIAFAATNQVPVIVPMSSGSNRIFSSNSQSIKSWRNKCQNCGSRIEGGMQRFEEHLKTNHQLKCMCGEEFLSKTDLNSHLQEKGYEANIEHSVFGNFGLKHAPVRAKPTAKAPYECDFCDEIFVKRGTALEHRKLHTNAIVKPTISKVSTEETPKRIRKPSLKNHGADESNEVIQYETTVRRLQKRKFKDCGGFISAKSSRQDMNSTGLLGPNFPDNLYTIYTNCQLPPVAMEVEVPIANPNPTLPNPTYTSWAQKPSNRRKTAHQQSVM